MLIVISPAKKLDYEPPPVTENHSSPAFLDDAEALIGELGDLNFGRYLNWHRPFTPDNAKQAVLAFSGDVYTGLDAPSLSEDDLAWAQDHLRILSGLYGVLRPLDLMQPYRLEMGTRFANQRGGNLYEFWGNKITEALNEVLAKEAEPVLVNLASNEYFKAVNTGSLKGQVITPVFRDWKNGQYKVISFYAKKARGMMANYIIRNRLIDPEDIKAFEGGGYRFNLAMSTAREWVFVRDGEAGS